MARKIDLTAPVGRYIMKKPRPVKRKRPVLTLDQYVHSQAILSKVKQAKEAIVVAAIMWAEPGDSRRKANLLEELRRCVREYHKLGTFPKLSTTDEE